MRSKFVTTPANSNGFTLIELVVSLAIISCILVALTELSKSTVDLSSALERTQGASMVFDEIQNTLTSKKQCTLNLKGLTQSSATMGGSSVQKISTFDAGNKPVNLVAESNQRIGKVKVQKMVLQPIAKVDKQLFVSNFEITFDGTSDGATMKKLIPVYVLTELDQVKECWLKYGEGVLEANAICKETSGGINDEYDVETKRCVIANSKWVYGTTYSARCPAGMTLPPKPNGGLHCGLDVEGGFQDTFTFREVQLSDGNLQKVSREPYLRTLEAATKTCSCAPAKDLAPSAVALMKCKVLCVYE